MSLILDVATLPWATSRAVDSATRWLARYLYSPSPDTAAWEKILEVAAAQRTELDANRVWIDTYAPQLPFPNAWLAAVEARIRESILPEGHDDDDLGEWLTPPAAMAALSFFEAGADVLPSEPHIYGTPDGDLVAEFASPEGRMTSVVSRDDTTLFAVRSDNPSKPIQAVIRRGSNRYREELRSFTKSLMAGNHGEVAAGK